MVPDQSISMKRLVLYSDMLEVWTHFKRILGSSSMDANGFLTLSNASAYLADAEVRVAHSEFWSAATYLLGKLNEDVFRKRKMMENRK